MPKHGSEPRVTDWEPGQLVKLHDGKRVELEQLLRVSPAGYEVWQGSMGGVLLITFASTDAELLFP